MSQIPDNQEAINSTAAIAPWQPIENAPKEGVVWSERGSARYREANHWSGVRKSGWYLCTIDDYIPYCREDGMEVSFIEPQPKLWMPVPALPPKGTY